MNKDTLKIEVNQISEKGKKSMKTRIIVALIMCVVCIPCLVLGGWWFFGLLTAVLSIAIYEMIKAPQRRYRWYVWVIVYILVFSFFFWFIAKSNLNAYEEAIGLGNEGNFKFSLENYCDRLNVSIFALGTALCLFLFIAIIHKEFDLHDVCYLFTISFLIGLGFQSVIILRYFPAATLYAQESGADAATIAAIEAKLNSPAFKYWQSLELILFFLIAVMFNDIYAYFGGVLFGKHHMNERISPKKTWEGFFIGWALAAGTAFAFGMIVSACGCPIVDGLLDINHWYWLLLLALVLPMAGNLGDFSFSLIKRTFGFKDFGKLLKDHGGILDRIDSTLVASIVFAILLTFIANGWNFLK